MSQRLKSWIRTLQKYADRWWYAPVIGALAFADLFLIIIPTDGLLISAVMLAPRRWVYTAVVVSLGSSIGALMLAIVIAKHGLPFLLWLSPGLDHTSAWTWTAKLMTEWGTWALFLIALSPMMQHPAIAIAALAGMSIPGIFPAVLVGRLLKYLFLSWLASHAPHVLGKLWGIGGELQEVGLDKGSHKPK